MMIFKIQLATLVLVTASAFQGTTQSIKHVMNSADQDSRISTTLYYTDDSQADVDDYLEFLDRRYNRLHGKQKRTPKELSRHGDDSAMMAYENCIAGNDDDDALCVLGVADLASTKLLQRRHLLPKEKYLHSKMAVSQSGSLSFAALMSAAVVPSPQALSSLVERVTPLLKFVYLQRKRLITQQTEQLKVVLACLSRSGGLGGVKSVKAIWQVGGGKKNIAWTFTVMIALTFLLLRPLAQAVAGQQQETLLEL